MEIQITKIDLLKKLIDLLKEISSEYPLYINENEIVFQSMDSSHSCMIHIKILPEFCQKFIIKEPFTIGFSVEKLQMILKTTGASDTLTLTCNPGSDTLDIHAENVGDHKNSRYSLKLMNIESQFNEVSIEYNVEVEINSSIFNKIIKDHYNFDSNIIINVFNNKITFGIQGDDVNCLIEISDVVINVTNVSPSPNANDLIVTGKYSSVLLNSCVKAGILTNKLKFYLKANADTPLCCEYLVDNLMIKLYIAPKIE
jgi:proliferating cell nuclear antigen PCNA